MASEFVGFKLRDEVSTATVTDRPPRCALAQNLLLQAAYFVASVRSVHPARQPSKGSYANRLRSRSRSVPWPNAARVLPW
jgi:hypothetical protein